MYISEWEWTDEVVDHLARHGVRAADVLAVWRHEPKYRRNRKRRSATHQMIGPDASGVFLAIFIRDDAVYQGRWRVVTGRLATAQERDWWRRS